MTFTYLALEEVRSLTSDDPLIRERVNIFIGRYPKDVEAVKELENRLVFRDRYVRGPLSLLAELAGKYDE